VPVDALTLITCSPSLPAAAQRHLARLGATGGATSVSALRVLAGRVDLDPQAADTLATHPNLTVRIRARRRSRAPGLLVRELPTSVLAGVAANPHTTSGLLADLTGHPATEVALRAVCNPAPPEAARRRALAHPDRIRSLVRRVSPLGAQVVRAGELAATNRWLLEHTRAQHPEVLRGLLTLPECPAELLRDVPLRWVSVTTHPTRLFGRPPSQLSVDELSASPSAAAHLALLERDECTAAHAARLLTADPGSQTRQIDPEPHILARIVRRFGAAPLTLTTRTATFAGTRNATAGWAEPHAGDLLELFAGYTTHRLAAPTVFAATSRTIEVLGEDAEVWSMFARLTGDGVEHPDQLIETAEVAAAI
jgi:hypothetical protein